jgi:fumarate reductase subunit C
MPRPYPRQHSNTWYLKRTPYRIFMLREWSATFIALYFVLFVAFVGEVKEGEAAFDAFVADVLQNPLVIVFHVIALLFAVLHTVTWFQAVPKAVVVRRGEDAVPPSLMIGSNYVAWLAVSAIVAAIFIV